MRRSVIHFKHFATLSSDKMWIVRRIRPEWPTFTAVVLEYTGMSCVLLLKIEPFRPNQRPNLNCPQTLTC